MSLIKTHIEQIFQIFPTRILGGPLISMFKISSENVTDVLMIKCAFNREDVKIKRLSLVSLIERIFLVQMPSSTRIQHFTNGTYLKVISPLQMSSLVWYGTSPASITCSRIPGAGIWKNKWNEIRKEFLATTNDTVYRNTRIQNIKIRHVKIQIQIPRLQTVAGSPLYWPVLSHSGGA